jgi:hypothetical protein
MERFIECHRPAFSSAAFRHGEFVGYDFMIFSSFYFVFFVFATTQKWGRPEGLPS